jgi:hypothetical protein
MSNQGLIRRNSEGVLLRYSDPADRRPHDERKVQGNDLQRIAILKAERALFLIQTITDHADFSDRAVARIEEALIDINEALQLKRQEYCMYVEVSG